MALRETPTARAASDRVTRYAEHIIEMHSRLTYRRLPLEISGLPAYVSDELGDGLLTLTCSDSQIPPRYMKGILGFRLSEYLRRGMMSRDIVYEQALYHEPAPARSLVENLHTVTMDVKTGQILGYIGLASSPDPHPTPLDEPHRARFLVEQAHDVDLLAGFAHPGINTHQVFETKRFVRTESISSEETKAKVPWHLLLGIASAVVRSVDVRLIIGEATEEGALRHLRMLGFAPVVVDGTTPSLPSTELLWPMHDVMKFKPFAAPVTERLAESVSIIRAGLRNRSGLVRLVAELYANRRARR
jgi:hypothetical protein